VYAVVSFIDFSAPFSVPLIFVSLGSTKGYLPESRAKRTIPAE